MSKKKRNKEFEEVSPLILQNVPADLKKKFKQECHRRGYTMTGRIRLFMREFIRGKVL